MGELKQSLALMKCMRINYSSVEVATVNST